MNGFQGGYGAGGGARAGGLEGAQDRERGPRPPFRGGRRGGYRDSEFGDDYKSPPQRTYERHIGTGRGYEMKCEGAGCGNWGTSTDEILTRETEEALKLDEKAPIPEKQGALEDPPQAEENKDSKDAIANEEEEKEMTLEEFEKLREEKRKALLGLKTKERKVEVDKDLQSMQPLSAKKRNDDVFIKLDALKKKENAECDERAKKVSVSNGYLEIYEVVDVEGSSMDLNSSPLPDEDDQTYEEPIDVDFAQNEHVESSVEIMRREREERRRKLKRELQDYGSKPHPQQIRNDHMNQSKIGRYSRIKEAPQGWLDCPASGEPIDKIVPSKVPLDETFNESVPPGKRYSAKQVVNKQRKAGREIGLVIDLTNTTRYYSPAEWTRQGTKHVKIACKGRDAVPDNESVNMFVYEVMAFLERQKPSRNPKYILVHCTHGHNRTGFMIIHYLLRTQLSSVTEALNIFAQRRPPGIYKNDYIQALYSFYHEIPENIVCPPTPEWKRSSDLDLNGEAKQDEDDDNGESAPSPNHADDKVITNDDVLGDAVPFDQQNYLRAMCFRLLDSVPNGRANVQFPGSHPVSLNSEKLQLLRQRYYYATWKADGTRYMMLILRDGCFLIDRNFCFRRVQMRFPLRNLNEGFHNCTLIDGEMVIDTIPDIGLKRRYLAYDLMALNFSSKVKMPFSDRWKLLEDEIIRPRNYEKKQFESGLKGNPSYRYDMEQFSVRRKDFWLLSTVKKVLKEFIPSLSHDSDGLIFQGWDDPYVTRTHEGLLKWKYPEMNSVDFLFEIGSENRQLIFLYERGRKKLMDGARVVFPDEVDPSSIAGKIVECSWNKQEDCWFCMRIRADKSTPNDINTYRKVMRSITDNITEDKLLEEINEIRSLPMYAEKMAPRRRRC